MANTTNYMNGCFTVKQSIELKTGWATAQLFVDTMETRASEAFRTRVSKLRFEEVTAKIRYAPVYRVFTKGAYNWTETVYHDASNPLIGNFTVSTEEGRSKRQNLDFSVDKSMNYGIFLRLTSYMEGSTDILEPVPYEKASSLPLLYPMLSQDGMVKEIRKELDKTHKGNYELSDLSIYMFLIPIGEYKFMHNGEEYVFRINLYDKKSDVMRVETAPHIHESYGKIEKIHKASFFGKIVLAVLYGLTFLIALLRDSDSMFMVVFGCILCGLLCFLPWKKQKETWEDLSENYEWDDDYIGDNGKYTKKGWMYVLFAIAQIVVPGYYLLGTFSYFIQCFMM